MVTMTKGSLSFLLLNLRKMLNHRVTVLGITTVLAIYVLWQAGSLVWKLWLINEVPPQPKALIPLSAKNVEPKSLQNLLRFPLIRSASTPSMQSSAATNAPKTSLNLKLVGLMYSTDQDQARAIIESQKEGTLSYSTHEQVTDNAEIYSIEPDRVILIHAGKREALMLDPEQNTTGIQSSSGIQPVIDPFKDQASTNTKPASNTQLASPESIPASNRSSTALPKNTAELMREFSATPVMDDGKLQGFRLTALRNPQILKEWGIGPSDVITAVNDIELNAPGRIMILYDKLKKQREFEITLSNGGNKRTVAIDLND